MQNNPTRRAAADGTLTSGCSDRLRAKASEHAVLLAEPTFQTREAREAVVSTMFEKQVGAEGVFTPSSTTLAAACGGTAPVLSLRAVAEL